MKKIFIAFIALITFASCSKDFLDQKPTDVVSNEDLEDMIASGKVEPLLKAYALGIYETMNTYMLTHSNHNQYGVMSIALMSDLWGQDMIMTDRGYNWNNGDYIHTHRDYTRPDAEYIWRTYYNTILKSNKVLEISEQVEEDKLTDEAKGYAMQAYGHRAYSYYVLANLYQHTYAGHQEDMAVPIVVPGMTDDELANNPRASVRDVYEMIEKDLLKALRYSESYGRNEKYEMNESVIKGLLARMYLSMEDYTNAAKYASEARAGLSIMSANVYNEGFKEIGAQGVMWGAKNTINTPIVQSGIVNWISFISSDAYGYIGLTGTMFKAIDRSLYEKLGDDDIRKASWTDKDDTPNYYGAIVPKYSNFKFKRYNQTNDNLNDYCFMRVSELVLIEAEAAAKGGGGDATSILQELLDARSATTVAGEDILESVYTQRKLELWGEGFSFFDLKRLKRGIHRDYDGTNHRNDARFEVQAEDNMFNLRLPISEINANNAISEADNNPL
ncbi:MAG: RagB/SusD family nutrient uptake outer membrane protein [Flavobacteriales bacterium]|nr:RagB/SusD family nutrient uptake outer membrane protein [Flavobacteriales bacterium]